jgi:hypothetical protein
MRQFQLLVSIFFLITGFNFLTLSSQASDEDIPEPECKEALNGSACGYNCEFSIDARSVACAEWPGGKCIRDMSSVSCGPPAPANWDRSYREGRSDRDRDYDRRDSRRDRRHDDDY